MSTTTSFSQLSFDILIFSVIFPEENIHFVTSNEYLKKFWCWYSILIPKNNFGTGIQYNYGSRIDILSSLVRTKIGTHHFINIKVSNIQNTLDMNT